MGPDLREPRLAPKVVVAAPLQLVLGTSSLRCSCERSQSRSSNILHFATWEHGANVEPHCLDLFAAEKLDQISELSVTQTCRKAMQQFLQVWIALGNLYLRPRRPLRLFRPLRRLLLGSRQIRCRSFLRHCSLSSGRQQAGSSCSHATHSSRNMLRFEIIVE